MCLLEGDFSFTPCRAFKPFPEKIRLFARVCPPVAGGYGNGNGTLCPPRTEDAGTCCAGMPLTAGGPARFRTGHTPRKFPVMRRQPLASSHIKPLYYTRLRAEKQYLCQKKSAVLRVEILHKFCGRFCACCILQDDLHIFASLFYGGWVADRSAVPKQGAEKRCRGLFMPPKNHAPLRQPAIPSASRKARRFSSFYYMCRKMTKAVCVMTAAPVQAIRLHDERNRKKGDHRSPFVRERPCRRGFRRGATVRTGRFACEGILPKPRMVPVPRFHRLPLCAFTPLRLYPLAQAAMSRSSPP